MYLQTSCNVLLSIVVPSAPPTPVTISKVTGTTITVQWRPVDCIHHNGDIIDYLLQYEAQESGDIQTLTAIGGRATISNLMSSTTYSIRVAAVNSAGTGEFSPAIITVTLPSECNMIEECSNIVAVTMKESKILFFTSNILVNLTEC